MKYITVGQKYNKGKVAFANCIKNDNLSKIDIAGKCFLLIILTKGRLDFSIGNNDVSAVAPSFLCFDESINPVLQKKINAEYICIYFHPKFLNINMSFEFLRSEKYDDIATTHDMFMLKPFIDKAYIIPICDTQIDKIESSAYYMQEELAQQKDWYWSCRGRSYFMEIIIALERMYGLIGYGIAHQISDKSPVIENSKLKEALFYIESHYSENITLSDISANLGINHTSLTNLIKNEFGCTAIEYLTRHRISVAKKQLAFTDVPIKDIAYRTGFKTVQHFTRIFKKHTGKTPAEFRKTAVKKRKDDIK